ncbi:MAG: beta-ketoacyl synthase N-terminal-like domain-containing protein [Spartobacteria bacterium]
MSVCIAGLGWATPLGSGVPEVWTRLLAGEEAAVAQISDIVSDVSYPAFRVPESALSNLPRHPRLRRASAISRFAAAAGLAALEQARSTIGKIDMQRVALIFAISNGGVIYTKRFYHDIVATGAQSASPLLFPETVFNAPASHLAAIVGSEGASYTLVGDGAVGILAVKMAEDLLASDALDYCLVVGAEEADWLLCDAYHRWRMARPTPPIEPFHSSAKGMILSEGAGAILIGRSGQVKIEQTHAGGNYAGRRQARELVGRVVKELATPDLQLAVASANGTFVDSLEASAFSQFVPDATIYTVKPALGESVGASAVWQIIVAAEALRTQQLPPLLHVGAEVKRDAAKLQSALVSSCGLNQQVAGMRLSI